MTTEPDPQDMAAKLAASMMDTLTALRPLFEAAQGLKSQLEADGWSPTAAEQIAEAIVLKALR